MSETSTVDTKRQAPGASEERPPRKIHFRRAHKKSHLGCANCKQRRIKCNEQLPVCGQCVKSNAKCSYLALSVEQIAERTLRKHSPTVASVGAAAASSTALSYIGSRPLPDLSPSAAQALDLSKHDNQRIGQSGMLPIPASSLYPSISKSYFGPVPGVGRPLNGAAQGSVPYPRPSTSNTRHEAYYSTKSPLTSRPDPVVTGSQDTLSGATLPLSTPSDTASQGSSSPSNGHSVSSHTESTVRTGSSAGELSIVKQGFETDMIRNVYFQWMSSVYLLACENSNLYHAIMSLSYGILAVKSQDRALNSSQYARESNKHRFIAIHELQQALADQTQAVGSPEALLATALILSWDIFFQEEDISSYVTLSKGFVAVLQRVTSIAMTEPNNTVLCMSDSLFQGIKAVQIPAYNRDVLEEILKKIDSQSEYLSSTANSDGGALYAQYTALASFLRDVSCYLLTAKRFNQPNGVSYFPPVYLFSLLRRWVRMFPSRALAMGVEHSMSQLSEPAVVLFSYYHATTRVLDALFPEMRYLFQFGFIGPIELVGIEGVLDDLEQTSISHLLVFPKKVISFFRERLFHYNRLIGSKNPLANHSGPPPFVEVQVKSFERTTISLENFPSVRESELDDTENLSSSVTSSQFAPERTNGNIASPSSTIGPNSNDTPTLASPGSASVEAATKQAAIFQAYFHDRLKILASLE